MMTTKNYAANSFGLDVTTDEETSAGAPNLRTVSMRDEISATARKLWEKYGCPMGRDEEIWLEAERQFLGADGQVIKKSHTSETASLRDQDTSPVAVASESRARPA